MRNYLFLKYTLLSIKNCGQALPQDPTSALDVVLGHGSPQGLNGLLQGGNIVVGVRAGFLLNKHSNAEVQGIQVGG